MDPDFDVKIKNSFVRVREDIQFIKEEVEKLKEALNSQNKENLDLKRGVEYLKSILNDIRSQISSISIGNHRVVDDKRQSMTINDNDKQLKFLLENRFRSLTDREFSVFTALYQLEEELGKVTYRDIANKLNLTEGNVRNYISSLMGKGIPVGRERLFNGKTIFFIKKELRNLNVMADLIELRQNKKI